MPLKEIKQENKKTIFTVIIPDFVGFLSKILQKPILLR